MTTFRSSKNSSLGPQKEEPSSNWYRLGLLSRNSTRSKFGSSSSSSNSRDHSSQHFPKPTFASPAPSLLVEDYSSDLSNSGSLRKRFGGGIGSSIRHRASENHIHDRYNRTGSVTPSVDSIGSATPRPYSSADRSGSSMAGMLDMERGRSRRDRTFVGSQCAICEEPLEHTFRNERVLQFSCSHVSHEACFYEYIKEFDTQFCPECNAPLGLDTSRGGNVLDLEKLSSIVRSVSVADGRETPRQRDYDREIQNGRESRATRDTRDTRDSRDDRDRRDRDSRESNPRWDDGRSRQGSRTSSVPDTLRSDPRRERELSTSRHDNNHWRSPSGTSGADFPEAGTGPVRRHDYDVQSMESDLSPRNSIANPIPAPVVTIKSEFPTISRSKVQQSLTCLVTVEIAERKWTLGPDEPLPPLPTTAPPMPNIPAQFDGYNKTNQAANRDQYDPQQSRQFLDEITENLRLRVENWHGLDFARFGKLRLHGTIKVGKDRQSWQELECYLFSEMLICVKEKKIPQNSAQWQNSQKKMKCTLKGSILIKKHLKKVTDSSGNDEHILTLSLSVTELPQFHLLFPGKAQLQQWQRALLDLHNVEVSPARQPQYDEKVNSHSDGDDDDYPGKTTRRVSSVNSSFGGPRSVVTAPTEYSASVRNLRPTQASHVPIDIVVVIPVSSSMQGLKINLLRDSLKFLVQNLGEKDRMGLVTFGSSGGAVPLVGMTTKNWPGWNKAIQQIRPVGPKSLRADVVEGANAAMDLLMARKSSNPIASILLISDSSTSDTEAVDFVVQRAEAAKITIHSFGLGLTHKPDSLIELSTRTKATYTYVKDWMMLRECIAGVVGSLQSVSHQNAKLKLKLPEGSPARFFKISGALHISKRASGRDAEASLGDLRFGDKKDILVQLVISPDTAQQEDAPHDAWESIVSGLEALGGGIEQEDQRPLSVEEVPLIQADLVYGDIQRDGSLTQVSRPTMLPITMLPASTKKQGNSRPSSPPIPPHPMVVQRRMELLTSDMLTRALTLISKGQHDRGQTLLQETRTILRGLGKGGLPPLPTPGAQNESRAPSNAGTQPGSREGSENGAPPSHPTPTPPPLDRDFTPAAGIDPATVSALDAELEAALEWINHPAQFARDSRKAVLQAIGVISSQRGMSFRTPSESLWAGRIAGIKRLTAAAREWRDPDDALAEEE